MRTIHIARDGNKLGTFSLEEVQEGLRTGRFRATDLAWETGMTDWRPLSEVAGPLPAGPTEPPPVVTTDGLPLPAPAPASAGSTVAVAAAAIPGAGLPWENREQLGFFKAFFDTVIMVLTRPAEAFTAMKKEGGLGDPLLFALIGGSAGMIVSFLFQMMFQSIGFLGDRQNAMAGIFGMGIGIVGFVVIVPLLVVFGMFVGGGVLHLCLMIVGGANRSFETTFRVVCFTCGSTYLLSMVPFCGGMVAAIYGIVVECIGLARAHETTTGKAVMAVFLPIVVCCGGAILIIIFAGGIGVLSQLGH